MGQAPQGEQHLAVSSTSYALLELGPVARLDFVYGNILEAQHHAVQVVAREP